ncbi:hypothetical protein [Sphingomonas sp. GC_Shp_3]|uniref:hypothetical protein n=1 Tax=Sphingomonas sp. GC_Shp_3 TaxID=2937383 RepID=UPI00226A283B|nr:hypothetical protein [Sphingomonas sp. GC_Shp_3]
MIAPERAISMVSKLRRPKALSPLMTQEQIAVCIDCRCSAASKVMDGAHAFAFSA